MTEIREQINGTAFFSDTSPSSSFGQTPLRAASLNPFPNKSSRISFTKWIYAVPYVHRFQYFEMPLLGLFGYIPFGIECLVITDAWMIRYVSRAG